MIPCTVSESAEIREWVRLPSSGMPQAMPLRQLAITSVRPYLRILAVRPVMWHVMRPYIREEMPVFTQEPLPWRWGTRCGGWRLDIDISQAPSVKVDIYAKRYVLRMSRGAAKHWEEHRNTQAPAYWVYNLQDYYPDEKQCKHCFQQDDTQEPMIAVEDLRRLPDTLFPDTPRPLPPLSPGIVYILHAQGTPRIKIGYTSALTVRLETLQTASPYPLRVLRSIPTQYAVALEAALHRRYASYRKHGEWFELPMAILQELLSEAFTPTSFT
jgi:hypothetical protein